VVIRRDQVAIKGRKSWARTGKDGQSRARTGNQGLTVNVFFAVWIAKLSNPTVGPILSPASFVGEPRTSWLWRVGDVDERDLDISCEETGDERRHE
jgi:hypothetical protein